MTKEEAINSLESIRDTYLNGHGTKENYDMTLDSSDIDAIIVAISVLFENVGDLISRQAVENITWEEPSYSDPLNVLTEVREKVRALPSVENKGEWIPTSERLPEDIKYVLVTDGLDIFTAWYNPKHNPKKEMCKGWHSFDDHFDLHTPILAWQPLPEPYKVERGE